MTRPLSMIPAPEIPRAVGALIAGTSEDDLIGMGSAVHFGPGIALTATHVVEEIFELFQGCAPSEAAGTLSFGVHLVSPAGDGEWLKWDVMGYSIARPLDIAALTLSPAEENPGALWPTPPTYSARYPAVDQPLFAFGFPKTRRIRKDDGCTLILTPTRSSGSIREVYSFRRDDFMMPFPSVRSDASFPPGISGGPVCDKYGRVFGLVASEMPTADPRDANVSYVSLIWPCLGLVLNTEPGTGKSIAEFPLLDFVKSGHVVFEDHDLIAFDRENGVERLRMRPAIKTD
jgi:hypothetical protein